MKFSQFVIASIVIFSAHNLYAIGSDTPETAPVKTHAIFGKVYIPEGFDNNDNVQIVGEGAYSNSCYRNAETLLNIDHKAKVIVLAPLAYKYGGLCLQVMMPFDRVVDLGILEAGTYTLVNQADKRLLGRINIGVTKTQGPDDTLYAPISQAYVQVSSPTNKIFLAGDFPLSCMRLKDVQFRVQQDVLVVLPLAEMNTAVPCNKGKFPFEISKDIGTINSGRYLLHVRSMNGKSINSLFDVR